MGFWRIVWWPSISTTFSVSNSSSAMKVKRRKNEESFKISKPYKGTGTSSQTFIITTVHSFFIRSFCFLWWMKHENLTSFTMSHCLLNKTAHSSSKQTKWTKTKPIERCCTMKSFTQTHARASSKTNQMVEKNGKSDAWRLLVMWLNFMGSASLENSTAGVQTR